MRSAYAVVLLGVAFSSAIAAPAEAAEDRASPVPPGGAKGNVVEVIDTAGYTYVRVDTGAAELWVAAPDFEVEVGDRVEIPSGLPMRNHFSKTLNRSFELVLFVSAVTVEGKETASHTPTTASFEHPSPPQPPAVELSGISRAAGGYTVGEIYDRMKSLADQEVTIRGRVVKFMSRIMGKNWIHLRDGTAGANGGDDLTVTTDSVVAVGDTILVRGVLGVDRDFGFGYKYDVIIEDASVALE